MEILDKILEINTYTELVSYFKEVISQLGKTRIKALYHTSGMSDFIDGELYIVFEDNRALVIANKLTSFGCYEFQSKYNIWYNAHFPKRENEFTIKVKGKYIETFRAIPFSESFRTHPSIEEYAPDGGDYYSRAGLFLNTGDILSFYGYSAEMDGYMGLDYAERKPVILRISPDFDSTFHSNYNEHFSYNQDVFIKYKNYGKLIVPGMKELITEYTSLQKNVLNSGTDNPYMDEETRQYFKTKSREITNLIQQKLPKRYRVIPDDYWESFL